MDPQMELPAFRELPPDRRAKQRALIVSRTARRHRRRPAVVLAAVLAVLVVTPAFALRNEIDFWSAEPAPERIQLQFDEMRKVFAPAGGLIPNEAREVTATVLDGERRPLWVAPRASGGFCFHFHHLGACDASFGFGGLQAEGGGLDWMVGVVPQTQTERVVVRYEDGETAVLPFIWVSAPIDAGFVLFDVPAKHEQEGSRPVAVTALDGEGRALASQPFRWAPAGEGRSRP
jgi:hypothetical protein